MDSERTIFKVSAVIEATDAEANDALEAIARALCPDDNHEGECPVPWTLVLACRFDDLSRKERASWMDSFEEDRRGGTLDPSDEIARVQRKPGRWARRRNSDG